MSGSREERRLRALVERSKRGDVAAFEELTVAHAPDMYRLAAAMVGQDDAADMVQDAFVLAWRELPRLRDVDRWESWLRSILMNRCRNALRTRSRRPRIVMLELDATGRQLTHEPIRDLDNRWAMHDALEVLRPEVRAVIALHYLADLPLRDVATTLGLRLGTVKSRLNAGLRALRAVEAEDRLA